jgi:shikimate kinase
MQIYITGFRATGKSTVAKALAKQLGFELVDMDSILETKFGVSISEFLEKKGTWFDFRLTETELLLEIVQDSQTDKIISCGGGVGVNDIAFNWLESGKKCSSTLVQQFEKNISKKVLYELKTFGQLQSRILRLAQNAKVILLECSEQTIAARLAKDYQNQIQNRPNLVSNDSISTQNRVEQDLKVYKTRKPLYKQNADTVVNSERKIEAIIQDIIDAVNCSW